MVKVLRLPPRKWRPLAAALVGSRAIMLGLGNKFCFNVSGGNLRDFLPEIRRRASQKMKRKAGAKVQRKTSYHWPKLKFHGYYKSCDDLPHHRRSNAETWAHFYPVRCRPLEQQLQQHLRQVISVLIFHLGNFSVVRFLAPIFLLVSPGRAIWEGEAGISKESSRFSFSGTCSSLLEEGCSHRQVLKEKLNSGVEKEAKRLNHIIKVVGGKGGWNIDRNFRILHRFTRGIKNLTKKKKWVQEEMSQ